MKCSGPGSLVVIFMSFSTCSPCGLMIGSLLIRPRVWYVLFQHCFSVYALVCIYAGRELFTGKSVRSAKQRPEELAGPNMPTWLLQETQRVGLGFCSAVFGIGGCSLTRRV